MIWTIVLRILQIGTWFRDLAIHGNELQAKGIKKPNTIVASCYSNPLLSGLLITVNHCFDMLWLSLAPCRTLAGIAGGAKGLKCIEKSRPLLSWYQCEGEATLLKCLNLSCVDAAHTLSHCINMYKYTVYIYMCVCYMRVCKHKCTYKSGDYNTI